VAGDIPTLTASKISDFATTAQGYRLDQFAVPNTSVSFNSQKITSLADPTNAQDAATKAYVDAARSGLDVKQSVRATTTANITLSGTQTIDDVVLVAGDRVLVKNQSTASQNGIYVVAAGSWARATDADSDAEVSPGMFCFVEEGTLNGDSGWVLATNSPTTLGTTALTFAQFSGTGQITAGDGLTKDGNILNVVTASSSRIAVSADSIDLASGVVTTGTYKSVTVDTYGRVTAGTNPTTLSGYGITDALSSSSDIDGGSYP
jgi:phage-related tail fiber protein